MTLGQRVKVKVISVSGENKFSLTMKEVHQQTGEDLNPAHTHRLREKAGAEAAARGEGESRANPERPVERPEAAIGDITGVLL